MPLEPCHAEALSPRAAAKALIIKLGVKRVAGWCGVTEFAIYQWFHRKDDAEPVPPRHVSKILAGAAAEGEVVDPYVLWPSMPRAAA